VGSTFEEYNKNRLFEEKWNLYYLKVTHKQGGHNESKDGRISQVNVAICLRCGEIGWLYYRFAKTAESHWSDTWLV